MKNSLRGWVMAGFLVCGLAWLTGCASTGGGNNSKAAYLASLDQSGVSPATVSRVGNERVLTFAEIREMVVKGVPGSQIVAYLKSTRANYSMSNQQIQSLVAAGADSTLVNYLGRGEGDFLIDAQNSAAQNQLVQNAKWEREMWNNPYFMDPAFDGDVPFEFGWPAIW
jgi:hypothetical protein